MTVATSVVMLTVRMLASLAVVLLIIGVAYLYARRKAGTGTRRRFLPAGRPRRAGSSGSRLGARGTAGGLEVVGRVGLTRGAAAVAVRFGDRIVLVAAGETGTASALAEMPAVEWDEAQLVREPIEFPGARHAELSAVTRPGFVEALRLATSRKAG